MHGRPKKISGTRSSDREVETCEKVWHWRAERKTTAPDDTASHTEMEGHNCSISSISLKINRDDFGIGLRDVGVN